MLFEKFKINYFKTFCSLAPNKAPGLDVGTRRNVTSPGTNRIVVFNTRLSVSFNTLFIFISCNQARLNCN